MSSSSGPSSQPAEPRRLNGLLEFAGRILHNRQLTLLALGLLVGAVAAGGAIAFRELIGAVQWTAFGFSSERVASLAAALPWWQLLLAPAAGGLVIGLFIHYAMPGRTPEAVAHVMEAAALKGGRMDLRAGLAAAVASAASIGVGASVGREGPVVHLGASLSSWLAQKFGLTRQMRLTMLGCGVASAIAASFNAPIAGVFFALEVVLGSYAMSSFAPIVIASVTGTVISRLYYGNFPAFIIPHHTIVSFLEFPAFVIVGIAAAGVAIAFIEGTMALQARLGRLPGPPWIRPALAGLVLGAVAIEFPQVLGVGYETTDAAIAARFGLFLLMGLLVLKLSLTMLCLGAGFGGGVFSPSLVMGALLGGAIGTMAGAVWPELWSGSGPYAIVGMGAVAGAVLGAPISTILIVFELTSNFTLTIAVMVGVVIASVITQQVAGRSFFAAQLAARGVYLEGGRERALLQTRRVEELMETEFEPVATRLALPHLREKLRHAPHGELFVVDDDGRLAGTITLADLADAAFDTSYDTVLRAVDVARAKPPALTREANLEDARKLVADVEDELIAVIDDAESRKLVGFVTEREVMLAYSRALMQARAEERGEG